MQFPYPITRLLRVTNADGTTAIQIGPGPTATWYGTDGSEIIIDATGDGTGQPAIYFWNAAHTNRAYINLFASSGNDSNLGLNGGGWPSVRWPAETHQHNTLLLDSQGRSIWLGGSEELGANNRVGGQFYADEVTSMLELLDPSGNVGAYCFVTDVQGTDGSPMIGRFIAGIPKSGSFTGTYGLSVYQDTGYLALVGPDGQSGIYIDSHTTQIKNTPNGAALINADVNETWHTPTLLNGWTHTSGYGAIAYRKSPIGGQIEFKGTIHAGTITDSTALFNLPSGYYTPGVQELMTPGVAPSGAGFGSSCRLYQNGSGQIQIYGASGGAVATTDLCFNGCSYYL